MARGRRGHDTGSTYGFILECGLPAGGGNNFGFDGWCCRLNLLPSSLPEMYSRSLEWQHYEILKVQGQAPAAQQEYLQWWEWQINKAMTGVRGSLWATEKSLLWARNWSNEGQVKRDRSGLQGEEHVQPQTATGRAGSLGPEMLPVQNLEPRRFLPPSLLLTVFWNSSL